MNSSFITSMPGFKSLVRTPFNNEQSTRSVDWWICFLAYVLSRLSHGSNYHHETVHGVIVSLIGMFVLLKLYISIFGFS